MTVDLVYLAVATMLVPALAEIAKIRSKISKPLEYIAAGGVLFVMAAAFQIINLDVYVQGLSSGITTVASVIGLIFVLVGGVLAILELMK